MSSDTMGDRSLNRDTRRFHRKSRNGCMQCKQRHVKCDENKPSCGNCTQTNRACSFLRMLPSIPTSLATSPSSLGASGSSYSRSRHNSTTPAIYSRSGPPTPASAVSSATSPSSTAATSAATGVAPPASTPVDIDAKLFSLYNSTPTPEFNLADLSMMHNWSTETSLTLASTPEVQQVWARTIVQLALQHQFLLHGLLAISALHVAYTRPASNKEYTELVSYAAQHQNFALSLFQRALANPTPGGQREALFVSSVLISVTSIATLRDEISDAMEIDIITTRAAGAPIMDFKWMRISRGIMVFVQEHVEELARGPVGLLVRSDVTLENGKWQDKDLADDLRHLQRLWHGDEPLSAIEGLEEEISTAQRDAFDEAYVALISTRSKVTEHLHALQLDSNEDRARRQLPRGTPTSSTSKPCVDSRVIAEAFVWLIRVPEEYIELLERQHPIALIILAHYAALLGKECATWWSEKSAYMIIRRVWVVLDERLRKWIESPMGDVRRATG